MVLRTEYKSIKKTWHLAASSSLVTTVGLLAAVARAFVCSKGACSPSPLSLENADGSTGVSRTWNGRFYVKMSISVTFSGKMSVSVEIVMNNVNFHGILQQCPTEKSTEINHPMERWWSYVDNAQVPQSGLMRPARKGAIRSLLYRFWFGAEKHCYRQCGGIQWQMISQF